MSRQQTQFKKNDGKAVESGRLGGVRSGEVRRAKAERRSTATSIMADIVYREYLKDVTEDELRDFIRWRGQRKRATTLAQQKLDDIECGEDEEVHEAVRSLLKQKRFPVRHGRINMRTLGFQWLPFKSAMQKCEGCQDRMFILEWCINYVMTKLEQTV